MKPDGRSRDFWLPTVAIAGVLVAWGAAAHGGLAGGAVLAGPIEVARLIPTAVFVEVLRQFAHTALRALAGWGIALVLGAALGLTLGARSTTFVASRPLFELAASIPPVLALPVFLVIADYGEPAYVWTVVFGCLPVAFLSAARGYQALDPGPLRTLQAFGATRAALFAARLLEAAPAVFLGARVTFSLSLIIAVVSEMVSTPRSGLGIGSFARDAEMSFQTPTFYLCLLVVGAYTLACNRLAEGLERRLGGAGSAR